MNEMEIKLLFNFRNFANYELKGFGVLCGVFLKGKKNGQPYN